MMKRIAGWIGVACLLASPAATEEPRRIDAHVLGSEDTVVVGRLGHPLGTVVVIEAALRYRVRINPFVRDYTLVVHRVNGVDLPAPEKFTYTKDVGSDDHGLPEACVTLTPEDLAQSEEHQFRKGKREESSDTRHVLFVHEAAAFSGVPVNIPANMRIPLAYEWSFGFETTLVVHHEDAVTRFRTRLPAMDIRWSARSGRAPGDKEAFYRDHWSATLDVDPWITTQPEELARAMRAEFVAAAVREGGTAFSVERGLDAWAQAVRTRPGQAVPVAMIRMAENDPPAWVIVWKEFRWSDDPGSGGEAHPQPSFGAVRWATCVADHCTVIRADDGAVVRQFEVYRFSGAD